MPSMILQEALLYVGITVSFPDRIDQHLRYSQWLENIKYITLEWFETRNKALEAEKNAIINENPIWNIVFNLPNEKIEKENSRNNPNHPKRGGGPV